MRSQPGRRWPSARLGVTAITAVATLGCSPGAEPPRPDAAATRAAVDTVEVALLEYAIGMPTRIAAGNVTLRLSNQGFELHNLKVFPTGANSPIWQTSKDINPGEVEVVSLDLAVGSYNVRCDVAGHDMRGMQINIEVEERKPGEPS